MKYKISQILTQIQNTVQVNPSERYKLLGLRLEGRGLFIREDKEGIEISATSLNKVRKGDFVYSRLFAWKGSFDYVREGFDDCYVSNEFPTFEIDKTIVNIDYLFYYFNQKKVWKEVEQYCIGVTKASRNRFKEKFFLSMEIDLPTLIEQERIVFKINSIKNKINEIKKLSSKQERDANNLTFSIYTDLIENCEFLDFKKVATNNRKKVEIEPDKVYYELGVRSFGRGTFVKPSFKGIDLTWQQPYWMNEGDLLFSNIKAWEGAVALISKEEDGKVGSHRYITYKPNNSKIESEFLLFHLLLPKGIEELSLASPGTADRNRTLGLKKLEAIKVPIPKIEEQRKFVELLHQFKQIVKKRVERENELSALIPSLLDKAFKGEL